MPNGHDKDYFVLDLTGMTADQIKTALDAAVVNGFDQWRGVTDKFVFLYGKEKH